MKKPALFISSLFLILTVWSFSAHAETEETKVYRARVNDDGIQKVEIVGGSYYYDPNYIIVKVDVPVELTFRKTPGLTPHNIIIDAPEAGININEDMGSDPKTVTFTPAKTGTYAIYCDKRFLFFDSHREKGMEGVLEVVE